MPKAGYACGGYRLAVLPAAAAASGMADKESLRTRVIQEYIRVYKSNTRTQKQYKITA